MRARTFRWVMAAGCLIGSALLMKQAMKIAGIGAAGHVIGSVIGLVTVVLLVAPETAIKIAEWCSKPFTDLLFPSERYSKPPLSYRLARHYSKALRLEDAVEEYRNIIHYYPGERDAYIEMIEVAQQLGNEGLCLSYRELYRKRFSEEVPETASQVS